MPTVEEMEQAARMGRPQSEFADARFPTVYADGVASLTPGPGLVRFFLNRVDPNMLGRGGVVNNPIAQVVMQQHGFVQMVVFFRRQMQAMIAQNFITQDLVNQTEAEFDRLEAALKQAQSAPPAAEPR
jgi:hypothetical protein